MVVLVLFFFRASGKDIRNARGSNLVKLELVDEVLHALVSIDSYESSIFHFLELDHKHSTG